MAVLPPGVRVTPASDTYDDTARWKHLVSMIPADKPTEGFVPQSVIGSEDKGEGLAQTDQPALDEITAHVRNQFQRAAISRNRVTGEILPLMGIDNRFIDCQPPRHGVYHPETSAAIAALGGTERYHKITPPKIESALAQITDVYKRTVGLPYSIRPAPMSELPEDFATGIRAQLLVFRAMLKARGIDVHDPAAIEQIHALYHDAYDRGMQAVQKEADERADRMQQKIERQLDEAGWDKELRAFLDCFVTYFVAVMKGPFVQAVRKEKWVNGRLQVVVEPTLVVRNINPQDWFAAPNTRDPEDSWCIQLLRMDKHDLADLRDEPGYSKENIEKALEQTNAMTMTALLPINEPIRAALENRDTTINMGVSDTDLIGLEYWGPIEGKLLKEWNIIPEGADEFASYQVCAIVFGGYCIKCVLNPHPLGKNPYHCTNWQKLPGDLFGKALAETMDDLADNSASAARALVNNVGLTSGPMVAYDTARIDPAALPLKVQPWLTIPWNSEDGAPGGAGTAPITAINIPSRAAELIQVLQFFESASDDRTGISRYNHGGTNVKGPGGDTARGMELFLGANLKGLGQRLANIDEDVTCPILREYVAWNNRNLPDDQFASLKGDFLVEPRGMLGYMLREELQRRRMAFAQMTNNPTDLEIMSVVQGRVTLLRVIAQDLDIPVDELVPSVQQMNALLMQRERMQMRPQGIPMRAARRALPPPANQPGAGVSEVPSNVAA